MVESPIERHFFEVSLQAIRMQKAFGGKKKKEVKSCLQYFLEQLLRETGTKSQGREMV